MKPMISILLCIALLLIFPGCQKNESVIDPCETTPSTQMTDPAPTEPAEESQPYQSVEAIPQQPMFSVYVPASTEEFTAADGTVIYRHTYQDMILTMPDPDVANKIIIDFLNRVDTVGGNSADLLAAAGNDYATANQWQPYSQLTVYSPTRIDQGILSLNGIGITYAGTAHPTSLSISANYDMITGDYLTLGDILTEEPACEQLYTLLLPALEEIKTDKQLYPYFDSVVRDMLMSDPYTCSNWYFSWDALHFFFSPYEIAPYTSGVIDVQIPYSLLLGIIEDDYFPPEYSNAGAVGAMLFDNADSNVFTQICEVTEFDGGERILLHSGSSAVSHVTLTYGTFDEGGIATIPNYTLFACSTLTPGDAILLETSIPDTIPNLLLSYVSGDESISKFITQSGKDGSILLID